MPNLVNTLLSKRLSKSLEGAEGFVVCSLAGLTVAETEGLRGSLSEKGVRLQMVRNRLVRMALRARGIELPTEALRGNTAMVWGGSEDAVAAAKVLVSSPLSKSGRIALRAGMMEGELLGPAEAVRLADIPDRKTLQAKLLGCLSGPARGLVTVLAANPSGVARLLQARADKAGAPEAPAAEAPPIEAQAGETQAGEAPAGAAPAAEAPPAPVGEAPPAPVGEAPPA